MLVRWLVYKLTYTAKGKCFKPKLSRCTENRPESAFVLYGAGAGSISGAHGHLRRLWDSPVVWLGSHLTASAASNLCYPKSLPPGLRKFQAGFCQAEPLGEKTDFSLPWTWGKPQLRIQMDGVQGSWPRKVTWVSYHKSGNLFGTNWNNQTKYPLVHWLKIHNLDQLWAAEFS